MLDLVTPKGEEAVKRGILEFTRRANADGDVVSALAHSMMSISAYMESELSEAGLDAERTMSLVATFLWGYIINMNCSFDD
jgi:hypothetical protein